MPQPLRYGFGILIAALLVGVPIGYSYYRQRQMHSFRVVREGVLYRSSQMTLAGLKQVLKDYDIKTVISLRDAHHPGEPPPDWEEERFCNAEEITYVRIPPARWWASDGSVPAEQGVRRFLEVMRHPENYPVLIHCCAGIHRTGAYCAVYRMECEGWSNERAIAEMKACGYQTIDDEYDLLSYLETYRPGQPSQARAAAVQKRQCQYRAGARAEHRRGKRGKHKKPKPQMNADQRR